MAIGAAFGMVGAFFMGGINVAGALGALALIIMKFFNIGNPNLWNIMGNRAWEGQHQLRPAGHTVVHPDGGTGPAQRYRRADVQRHLPLAGLHPRRTDSQQHRFLRRIRRLCRFQRGPAAAISRVALPAFRQRGYNERLVIGSLAAGGTLSILIPPSIGLVLYGLMVASP